MVLSPINLIGSRAKARANNGASTMVMLDGRWLMRFHWSGYVIPPILGNISRYSLPCQKMTTE
jgi:hypothetical protein